MKDSKPSFDSIIFDLDGTLWDAVGIYAESWNICLENRKINQSVDKSFLNQLMGLEEKVYLARVLPDHTETQRGSIYEEVVNIQYGLIKESGDLLYDGVKDGLRFLSLQYKLFIVSNCPEFTIRHFVERYGIGDYILDSISHGENFRSKHENIREIIERHQLVNSVYAGDTDSDRIQCNVAGVPFIFMEYGFGHCNDFLYKFPSFAEFTRRMLSS